MNMAVIQVEVCCIKVKWEKEPPHLVASIVYVGNQGHLPSWVPQRRQPSIACHLCSSRYLRYSTATLACSTELQPSCLGSGRGRALMDRLRLPTSFYTNN